MIWGTYKSYQDGNSNFMATVWQHNRVVRLVSTNSNPRNVHIDKRFGNNVIQVNQSQNIQLYKRYMNSVAHHGQLHMKHDVDYQLHMKHDADYFSVKAWKYILLYFVNTRILNAYILYCKPSTRQTKKKYVYLDF